MTYQFLSERRTRLAKIFVVVLLAVCSVLFIAARSSAAGDGEAATPAAALKAAK